MNTLRLCVGCERSVDAVISIQNADWTQTNENEENKLEIMLEYVRRARLSHL